MYWVFTDQAAANAAQQAATDALPDDTLITGQVSPVQITDKWADIVTLTDGTFAFMAKPGMALPSGATAVPGVTALLPPQSTVP